MENKLETLTGEVKEIIYVNEGNGYTIADFEVDSGNETTIVGYLPFINVGSSLKVVGTFVMHKDYGRQFKVDTFEVIVPQNLTQLEKYIGNGLISGIGPATAKRIIKTFGEDTLAVIKFEPDRLAEIKGITREKALKISVEFNESLGLWEIVSYLGKLGIEPKNAQTIYKKLGQETIEKVNENPYILVDLGIRVDFHQIDRMALQIGFEKTNLKRIDCGILHALSLASGNGHSCVLEENLIRYSSSLLGVSEEDIADGINDLIAKDKIVVETRDKNINWVYSKEYFEAESNIVKNIKALMEADNLKAFKNLDKRIKDICDINLSKEQLNAIKLVNDNNVTIITGGPGTGKTTIIKVIIEMYDSLKKKVVLCAPTGRAAKRMTEATGKDASTLHRLLEIGKVDDQGEIKANMPISPIDADVIVVDEMSMVDLFLMNYLLKGIYKGTKLVLVGDSDQLPSVGPGTVLKDLIESEKIPFISLNKIFRQAAKSQIIVNSHKVNEGISFVGEKENYEDEILDDFLYIPEKDVKKAKEIILSTYNTDTQIITPTKKGELGTKELNKLIQEKFNPQLSKEREKKYGDVIFREGDKVMQTKNNYDIEWIKFDSDTDYGSGIFNGEMGIITSVDNREGLITIRFEDGKMAGYTYDELEELVHSYAITVHKSQGSEFENVIMPILDAPSMLLTRNVLYTGMTRAKSDLKIIGSPDMIDYMVNNNKTKERNTGLKYKLSNI